MSFGLQVQVAIVGHSYVRRLLNFIDNRSDDIIGKIDRAFNLYKEDVDVTYEYKSGGQFKDIKKLAQKRVMRGDVDILVMMAGGNDIEVTADIKQLADDAFDISMDLIEADIV